MTAAPQDGEELIADYVIVGAGSAGCVLANRLSADGRHSVLLIEAGGDDRPLRNPRQFLSNLMIHVPVGYAQTVKDPRINWLYQTEPDPGTGNRRHVWPRGKVFGGSSSINGLLYVRGQQLDYDHWRQLGCQGWSWQDVAPYFRKAQHQERGADEWHGIGGPLNVSDATERQPVSDAVIAACAEAGFPRNDDINAADQEGAGYFQLTVKNGLRCSAAVAYLHPAMKRANLRVIGNALAGKVVLEGKRAVGVRFAQHGTGKFARARREIILAGGSINSPQLLQLSGIGPVEVLRAAGVETIVELPGVGENLQDHYITGLRYRLRPGVPSINAQGRGLRMAGEIVKYIFKRKGLLTLSAAHIAAFVKSRPDLASPDIQFHILPATVNLDKLFAESKLELEREPGLTLGACQLRPESRGHVRIASADPTAHPRITANYLQDRADQAAIVAGLRCGRAIAAQPALARYVQHELDPGPDVVSDEALLEFARSHGSTIYHPVGTCRMGHGPTAVVDPELCVRGVAGLRVVDAAVMPRLISGNTNAPTIMIAEKAADMILARAAYGQA